MQSTPSPLNPQTVQRIQAWLRTSESIEFRKLLATLATNEEVDALKSFQESTGDDGYKAEGFDHLEMAKRYEFMLHVIDSAAEGTSPGKSSEKFPYITLALSSPNAGESVEKLLQRKNEQS